MEADNPDLRNLWRADPGTLGNTLVSGDSGETLSARSSSCLKDATSLEQGLGQTAVYVEIVALWTFQRKLRACLGWSMKAQVCLCKISRDLQTPPVGNSECHRKPKVGKYFPTTLRLALHFSRVCLIRTSIVPGAAIGCHRCLGRDGIHIQRKPLEDHRRRTHAQWPHEAKLPRYKCKPWQLGTMTKCGINSVKAAGPGVGR